MTITLRQRIIILAILHCSCFSFAQKKQGQARLDSLLAEVPKMKEDTDGVKLMNDLSFEYGTYNPGERLKWVDEALILAQKLGWRKGELYVYNNLGNNYRDEDNNPAALGSFFKALSIAEDLGDEAREGILLSNIGNIYAGQKSYVKALEYHFKSLRIAKKRTDSRQVQNELGNIAKSYSDQGKYNEALEYDKQALSVAEELNLPRSTARHTGDIGSIYTSLKQYSAGLAYNFKALRLAKETDYKSMVAINLGNIGEAYCLIAKAPILQKPDSLVPEGRAANVIKAIEYLNKSIAYCRELEFIYPIPEFSLYLSDAYALQGNFKSALAAYKQCADVKDTLYNNASNEKIANLETKRALELKDKDILIAKLKKRNERILSIVGFAVLLLIVGILFRNFRKQQHSNALLSKEKKRSDDLLLNILPAEVAEELKESGSAHAKQFDNVSVLFTDFVNFTGTAEQLSPRVLVRELHECFTAFDAIIERNGLEKIKTIGDAYLAVCGLPVNDPRHAQKTVQAALEIRNFITERAKQERAFQIRIGINSGPVVAGIVGVKKFAYDIWGDTVNTAARMEQHGEPGRINISQSTYELAKGDFACDYRGKVLAKNKGEIAMYFVEAPMPETAV